MSEHAKMLREVDERVLPRRDWETDDEYGKRMSAYLNGTEIYVKNGCNHWPGQKRCGVCGMGADA